MIKIQYILCVMLILASCYSQRKARQLSHSEKENSSQDLSLYDFQAINPPFKMRVIDFIPSSAGCGTMTLCSNCLGITDNKDTVRVLSECPELNSSNNSLSNGEEILVIPDTSKKSITCTVPFRYRTNPANGKLDISAPQNKRYKTMYGVLRKIMK